jgi:predicted  nucleic acid-binding Zn-ribbon protein
MRNYEMTKGKCTELETNLQNVTQAFKSLEARFKKEKEKMMIEKEQLNKAYTLLQHRDTQYVHELRKKDMQIEKYKDQLKKTLDKNIVYKNNFELISNLHQAGPPNKDVCHLNLCFINILSGRY